MTNEEFADSLKNIIKSVRFEPDSTEAFQKHKLGDRKTPSMLSLEDLGKVAGGISGTNKGKKNGH